MRLQGLENFPEELVELVGAVSGKPHQEPLQMTHEASGRAAEGNIRAWTFKKAL